jgi:hypothetical protein
VATMSVSQDEPHRSRPLLWFWRPVRSSATGLFNLLLATILAQPGKGGNSPHRAAYPHYRTARGVTIIGDYPSLDGR